MYKVMIVDDEPWAIYVLSHRIDWEAHGFEIACTDGAQAYEQALAVQPHLILTDIKMPGMDGLQMTEALKTALPDTLVVLVSGYADFTYAQRGLQLGAFDYLLKQVEEDALLNVLARIRAKLDADASANQQAKFAAWFSHENRRSIRECLLQHNSADVLSEQHCTIAVKAALPNTDHPPELAPVGDIPPLVIPSPHHRDRYIAVFLHREAINIAPCPGFRLGYSSAAALDASFYDTYLQADVAVHTALCSNASAPVAYQPVDQQTEELCRQLITRLQEDIHHADTLLSELPRMLTAKTYNAHAYIYNQLLQKIREYGFLLPDLRTISYYQASDPAVLFAQLGQCIISEDETKGAPIPHIQQILDRIDARYTENISLANIAADMHISPNYLSVLLRKHADTTFTDLIIRKRIQLAKKLLRETAKPIQQIVEETGYRDYTHFNKSFKKMVGITPVQYRKNKP